MDKSRNEKFSLLAYFTGEVNGQSVLGVLYGRLTATFAWTLSKPYGQARPPSRQAGTSASGHTFSTKLKIVTIPTDMMLSVGVAQTALSTFINRSTDMQNNHVLEVAIFKVNRAC